MQENPLENDNINLLDCLVVLLKRKKFIITVTLGITLLTAIISLIIPKTFRAESKIFPPAPSQSLSAQLLGQLGGVTGSTLGGAAGIKTAGDLYLGLLKSRPVLDAIVDRFKLMEVYRTKYREDARRKALNQLTSQEERKSGIITVQVEDKDPKRAADMANAFVEELKNLNKSLAVTEASQRRVFYEEQLKEVKDSLLKAEESMKGFQESTGAVKIDDQARAVIQSVAQLRAQIAAREVQLKVMRTYTTAQNPDTQRLEEEIRGLRDQLGRLETKSGRNPDPLMPTGRMPQVGTDYTRKMRELKFNEALYEILLRQLEAAKMDEGREVTVIQVIEKAVPPEKKIKPNRAQMVLIAFIVSFFISIFGAFLAEFIEKSKLDPENKERFELMRQLASLRRSKG